MKMSLPKDDLFAYVVHQCEHLFPDGITNYYDAKNLRAYEVALLRTEECFRHILLRGFSSDGDATFSHLHSDQYAEFLYFFANSLWANEADETFAQKLLNLNRQLSGMFVSYKCALPEHFLFGHAVGTVIGNASYGDCCVFFQGVTVNTAGDGETLLPVIGRGVFFAAGSSVLGREPIGDRVSIGAGTRVYNTPVPDDMVVTNESGAFTVRPRKRETCMAQSYFDIVL